LATIANPTPGFVAYNEVAFVDGDLSLVMRTKSFASCIGDGLRYQCQSIGALCIICHSTPPFPQIISISALMSFRKA
jgi:hypothetical protein